MQFHPTCLYNLGVKNFLITEAVRGEGGHLLHPETGHRYMADYDPERMELAPRDIVARANDDQIKRYGLDYVHLDISHQPPDFVRQHFPTRSLAANRDRLFSLARLHPLPGARRGSDGHRRRKMLSLALLSLSTCLEWCNKFTCTDNNCASCAPCASGAHLLSSPSPPTTLASAPPPPPPGCAEWCSTLLFTAGLRLARA